MDDPTLLSASQREHLMQATRETTIDLRTIAQSVLIRDLSSLSLPEIDEVVNRIGRLVPAGNLPGMILSGLARLQERRPSPEIVQRDIALLFRGVERVLDRAVYGTFFAGPAAVLWGYQHLLKLAGKDMDAAFPEGTWQFYTHYALRDDTARHASETHGFDTALHQRGIALDPLERMTAWVMSAIHTLHHYDALLENEWRERVHTALLRDVTSRKRDAEHYTGLYRLWEKQRPYGRLGDARRDESYPAYRRRKFDEFLATELHGLRSYMRDNWSALVLEAETTALPAYQRQISILAYLEPGDFGEARQPLQLTDAQIGVIYGGYYFLIPACQPGSALPAEPAAVRAQLAGIVESSGQNTPTRLLELAGVKRAALAEMRRKLPPDVLAGLNMLRSAPILINFDRRARTLPLAELRQTERGIGDHPLTLLDTGETMVFDQSHIFFDGAWGAALAEIMTVEATEWALTYRTASPPPGMGARPRPLNLRLRVEDIQRIRALPQTTPEVCVETDAVDLKALLSLRKFFKRRSDLLALTVNDLLILYRAVHAITYLPSADLIAQLDKLKTGKDSSAAQAALAAFAEGRVSPAILIPIDASQRSPRDRLHPMTFEVPLNELNFVDLHQATVDAHLASEQDRKAARHFRQLQREYLAALAGLGIVLTQAKSRAVEGESASVGVLKLLANLPVPLQNILNQIPERFDILNDIIKGREVFSNIGAVAPTSTLTRFISAKDDNEKKTLAWGVLTDANGVMHITLRDFRPHVRQLVACGQRSLAARITQDYLDSYALGLNSYIYDLRRIVLAGEKVT